MSIRGQIEPIVQKWNGFAGKVSARVDEVVAEADAGLTELIGQHPTDHGPLGAAFSAVQARFTALTPKVDDAFEKISGEIDEAVDSADDLPDAEQRWVWDVVDGLQKQKDDLSARIDLAYEELQTRKNAEWARKLESLAKNEIAKGVSCSQCGAPFKPEIYWRSSQAKCGSCGAVNDVHPGMAAGLFFQGIGVHALSHAGAWNEWRAEREADNAFKGWRHPTAQDRDAHLAAARAYYTRYYQIGMDLHPELVADLSQAVEAKLAHYHQWDQKIDQIRRQYMGQLVDAARRNDLASVKQISQNRPPDLDLSDCVEALVERHLEDAARAVLDVQYDADGEDGDRRGWVSEQLADVRRTVLR